MFINWTWVSGRRLAVPVILAEIWMASAESVMKMQWHRFAEWVRAAGADSARFGEARPPIRADVELDSGVVSGQVHPLDFVNLGSGASETRCMGLEEGMTREPLCSGIKEP